MSVEYADTQISGFVIEYLLENGKVCKTILPVHGPGTAESFGQKIEAENLVTLSF